MAIIQFSAIVDEIHGKVNGSVIQNSYGGFQLRTRVVPRNPQSFYQQRRRGPFANYSATWRTLTPTQRQSFVDAVPQPGQALNLFIQSNVNLSLIQEAQISDYIDNPVTDAMPFEIVSVNEGEYIVKANGVTTIVPAGMKLLLYSTMASSVTKTFTNKSRYSPIVFFDEGSDLSVNTDIIADYNTRFGSISDNQYIALQSVLIRKENGATGGRSFTNTITTEMANKYIPKAQFTTAQPNTGIGDEVLCVYTVPSNLLDTVGDRMRCIAGVSSNSLISGNNLGFNIDNNPTTVRGINAAAKWNLSCEFIRINSNTVRAIQSILIDNINNTISVDDITSIDFTAPFDIGVQVTSNTAGSITVLCAAYDLIKA